MTVETAAVEFKAAGSLAPRWNQLFFGIICMVLIANLQYGWTLFVNPINKAHGWSIASIQRDGRGARLSTGRRLLLLFFGLGVSLAGVVFRLVVFLLFLDRE